MEDATDSPGGNLAAVRPGGKVLANVPNEQLLDEVNRRGILRGLHGAVGALYDHLERAGHLDSASVLTAYLACRLRREDATLSGYPDAQDTAAFWQNKIDELGLLKDAAAAHERDAPTG